MKRLGILLCLSVITGGTAHALELFDKPKEPITEKGAAELFILMVLLEEMRWALENGKEPIGHITGRLPQEVWEDYKARLREENRGAVAAGQRRPGEESKAGNGFELKNSRVIGGMLPALIGELVNRSGRDYKATVFTISLYDGNGALIGTSTTLVPNFSNGATKTFSAPLVGVKPGQIARYKVEFDTGY